MNTALDKRMKQYEKELILPINLPLILRIDGRAFHTFTRNMEMPFDFKFIDIMNRIGKSLCEEIQNCRMAFLQSDEISFLIYNRIESDTWFGNNVHKMCSVAASYAASVMNMTLGDEIKKPVSFDARVNVYPLKDVVNYFVWRQRDWERNSVQMVARSLYSHKELQGKNTSKMQEMIFDKGINWNDYDIYLKRGRCIVKKEGLLPTVSYIKGERIEQEVERSWWEVDNEIPIFTKDRDYIERKLTDDFIEMVE